jgi:hypothetical protein
MLSSSSQAAIKNFVADGRLHDFDLPYVPVTSFVRNDARSMGDIDLEQSNDPPSRQEVSINRDQLRSNYRLVTDPARISGFALAPCKRQWESHRGCCEEYE